MDWLGRLNGLLARLLAPLADLVALAARVYVGWQFMESGWLKLQDWSTTLYLFESEYRVPVLPPQAAAVAGTAGELVFPVLLILGLAGRLGALGLSAVNAMAVISYAHVLLQEGFEAAIGQHVLWGWLLVMVVVYGPGRLSVDHALARRDAGAGRPPRNRSDHVKESAARGDGFRRRGQAAHGGKRLSISASRVCIAGQEASSRAAMRYSCRDSAGAVAHAAWGRGRWPMILRWLRAWARSPIPASRPSCGNRC